MDLKQAVEEIKDSLDIVDILSEYIDLKKAGRNYKAVCPFHDEKTPSFVVSPEKQIFHCFGCGTGGDVVTFLMKHDGVPFPEAVKTLAERAGIKINGEFSRSGSHGSLKKDLIEIHGKTVLFFQDHLKNNKNAVNYLKKRGINDEAIGNFSLGFAPGSHDMLFGYLREKGYPEKTILASGLCKEGERGIIDTFRNRIIFPITNFNGDVIAFGGRTIQENFPGPKYLNSPETAIFKKSSELFGLSFSRREIQSRGYAILMEGYLDVITAHQYGIKNSVAPLGTSLAEGQVKRLKSVTRKVLLIFDSDNAGIRASKRAMSLLYEKGIVAKVLLLPGGDDPDSFLKREGADSFRRMFGKVKGLVEFYLSLSDDRVDIIRELIFIISHIKDAILRGELIKEIFEKTGLSEQFLREELAAVKKDSGRKGSTMSSKDQPTEAFLLGIYINFPEHREVIKKELSLSLIEDGTYNEIFSKLLSSETTELAGLQAMLREDEFSLLTAATMSLDIDHEQVEKNISDCIKKIREHHIKKHLRGLEIEMKLAENSRDGRLIDKLKTELNNLIKEGVNEGLL